MATKYGYVQTDPQDTQLNWSQIATDTVDMLNAEVKTREDKKAAIDQATADYQTILNNVPQGENTQLNEFALNAAEKLQKQMLMQETLLKSGQLNPKQYTIMRQNLTDGTDQAFSLLQDYNDEYAAKMAMMSADLPVSERASQMQTWMMEQVEGFANFTESELVVNPQTGIMSMAKLIPDPKYKGSGTAPLIPDPDPNNLVTVQQLQNRIKTKYTQYDVVGNAEEWIDTLGVDKRVEIATLGNKYKAGIFKTVKNIRNREGGFKDKTPEELQKLAAEMEVDVDDIAALSKFEQAQNTFIEGQLFSNSNIGASVLLDFARKTPDGALYDESVILLKSVNGRVQAELTDAQEAVATEAYRAQIDIGLDIEESVEVRQVYKPPTATDYARGDKKEKQASAITAMGKIYDADTPEEVAAAVDFMKSINDNITDVNRVGNQYVEITFKDGTGETLSFTGTDGTKFKSKYDWASGNINYMLKDDDEILDVSKAAKASGVDLSGKKPKDYSYRKQTTIPREAYIHDVSKKEISLDDASKRVFENESPSASEIFTVDNEDATVLKVNKYLLGTGYSAETHDGGDDAIWITSADDATVGIDMQFDDDEADLIEGHMKKLREIKYNNLTDIDKAKLAQKLKKTVTNKKGAIDTSGY
mgnify:CR=1 FL=1